MPTSVCENCQADDNFTPVYNAVFEGNRNKNPIVLEPDKTVVLRFDIGRPDIESFLAGLQNSVNRDIVNTSSPLGLTVIVRCGVCAENTVQTGTIVYDPLSRRSTTAYFGIHPSRNLRTDANPTGKGEISISIRGRDDGIEYDFKRITLHVTDRPDLVPSEPAEASVIALNPPKENEKNDIVIRIRENGEQGRVEIQFEPIDKRLKERMGKLPLDDLEERRWFMTDFSNSSQIKSLYSKLFLELSQLVTDDPLMRARLEGGVGPVDLSSPRPPEFTDQDLENILAVFARSGKSLYHRLFLGGPNEDENLWDIIEILEAFAGDEPLKIVFETQIDIPFQFLYPTGSGPLDGEKFWGNRFELAVTPIDEVRPDGPMRTRSAPVSQNGEMILAEYGVEKNRMAVPSIERWSAAFVQSASNAFQGMSRTRVTSREAFIETLAQKRDGLSLVVGYTHAEGGLKISRDMQGVVSLIDDARGARLQFGNGEYVTPSDFSDLVNNLSLQEIRAMRRKGETYLKQRPIVFLNACETGVGDLNRLTTESFQKTFRKLGAGAVVVTHAPVWETFALHFGNAIVKEIADYATVSSAVLKVRRQFLLGGSKNPLGLLYAFYGSPYSRLSPPPPIAGG